jgi:glycosyltransferase involved in cell wall biosynthesis
MPAFNAEKTINKSIESIINQSYIEWELIIINDGSTDETLNIINEYQKITNKIILINLIENRGLSNARNQGILKANGEYIVFLDSDDLWHRDKLRLQFNFHFKYPDCKISHTNFNFLIDNGFRTRFFNKLFDLFYKYQGNLYPQLIYKNVIGICTVCLKRDLLTEIGVFDTSLWTFEDQDLWIRASKKSKFGYINKVLASYRISPTGITSKISKYKKAYKVFLSKYFDKSENEVWSYEALSNYNFYFGIQYFKLRNYKLGFLYFMKSFKLTSSYWNKTIILFRSFFVFINLIIFYIKDFFKL